MSSSSPPYNALTLYTAGTPNGLKPAMVLEELGLKYDVRAINLMTNEQKEPWFLEINPNGRIPALKDGDLRVFESATIMFYLVDIYDKEKQFTYEHGSGLYYEMMSWVMFQMGGIGPMQGQANHFRAMAPVYSAYGIKRYIDETKRLYGVLEIRLSKADWLAGDKYTIADMANYSWVRAGPAFLDIDMSEFPGVDRWMKRIGERPAVQKARKIPDTGRSDEDLIKMIEGMKARVDSLKGTDKDEPSKI
ncbi:glutathione S-transferase [Cladophialophora psammophila CBS 110553]|uniref:Glutathione S-transferase n=1 Tax=Cladophialophora psammophila CBS 110553 TaxID=1182543 RepID=W9WH64_9EURO|nr:glutathione S-transferase [Cladophialophora psammophila CBS 110553]EXJ67472.1 glutathione S-transferase [Cladophialophora psammophila CBS 110553]